MLPTPSTSHVAFERVYEPAEDSFLMLDTLSSKSERAFLHGRFEIASDSSILASTSPLIVEVGTGSGVVLSFLHAYADNILGRCDIITAGIDVNRFACMATQQTVRLAEVEQIRNGMSHGFYLGNIMGDLVGFLTPEKVDILICNPPYVPTPELPRLPRQETPEMTYETDSHLLSLSYAGGVDGMETTNRLLESLPKVLNSHRGCAYVLLCAQNRPEEIKERIRNWDSGWMVETVGVSGKMGGWEKLQIIRIWRVQALSAPLDQK